MENGLLHIKTLGLMYRSKRNSIQTSLEFVEFQSPFGNGLSKDNRWVILANLIPWDLFEDDSFAPQAFAWAQRPGFGQAVQPQRAVKRARGIVRVSRPALLAPAHQPLPQALFDNVIQPSHDALRAAEPEVVLPAAQHCSICSIVIPSGPAAPRFAATRPQATSRNHGLLTLSYN